MSLPTNPINRKESYLNAIATGNTADMPAKPQTREEAYLDYIAKNGGGGGGDGTYNYEDLFNQPQINGNKLVGNKSSKQLGMQNLFTGTTTEWENMTLQQRSQYTHTAFSDDTEGSQILDPVPTQNSTHGVQSGGVYSADKAISDMISDAYDNAATYAVGDYCIYNNALYRCNTAIATPEAFTPAKWDATTVGEGITATQNKTKITETYIGASGHEVSVRFLRMGQLGMYIFNGPWYGHTKPSGISCYAYQRGVLVAGEGAERWLAHIESPNTGANIFLHKNGGETNIPSDGSYNIYGVYMFFIS